MNEPEENNAKTAEHALVKALTKEKESSMELGEPNLSPLTVPTLKQAHDDSVVGEDVDENEDDDVATREAIFKSLEQSIATNDSHEEESAMVAKAVDIPAEETKDNNTTMSEPNCTTTPNDKPVFVPPTAPVVDLAGDKETKASATTTPTKDKTKVVNAEKPPASHQKTTLVEASTIRVYAAEPPKTTTPPPAKKQTPKKSSKEKRVLVIVADGSEDIETVCVTDTLSRFGAKIVIASVHYRRRNVKLSRGLEIVTDTTIEDIAYYDYDCIVLPGGMQGALNLQACDLLLSMLQRHHHQRKLIGAICAAPATVLVKAGIVPAGATCYPADNLLNKIPDASVQDVVVTDHIITSAGPGTAIDFALKIGSILYSEKQARTLATRMIVLNYDNNVTLTTRQPPSRRKTKDANAQTIETNKNNQDQNHHPHYIVAPPMEHAANKRARYNKNSIPPTPTLLTIRNPTAAIKKAYAESPPIEENDLATTPTAKTRGKTSAKKSLKTPKGKTVKAKKDNAKASKPTPKKGRGKTTQSSSESEFELDEGDEDYEDTYTPTSKRRSPNRAAKGGRKRASSSPGPSPATTRVPRTKSPRKSTTTTPKARRSLSNSGKKSPKPAIPKSPKGTKANIFYSLLWPRMEKLGFRMESGTRPNDKYMFPPGITRKNGKNRVDFFDSLKGIMEYLKSDQKWSDLVEFYNLCDQTLDAKSGELKGISGPERMVAVEKEVLKSKPLLI